MGGLIKDFALTAFIIILNHWVYGIEDAIAYKFIVEFIVKYQMLILTLGFLGAGTLLISASMFESLGLYRITYGLSKIIVRVTQFMITFVTVLNIVFYAAIGDNLMRDNGYLMLFALGLILGASCWALRIIDFNHHTQNAVVPVSALTFLSVVLVEFVWPAYGF